MLNRGRASQYFFSNFCTIVTWSRVGFKSMRLPNIWLLSLRDSGTERSISKAYERDYWKADARRFAHFIAHPDKRVYLVQAALNSGRQSPQLKTTANQKPLVESHSYRAAKRPVCI
jgi:hypothetical protein